MVDGNTRESGLHAALASGGECGRLISSFDWAATSLGPMAGWPQSLVSSLSILLTSKAQICLFWGPEYVPLYNDAYRPAIGENHPRALGHPARENWAEIWDDVLEPLLSGVRTSGEAFSGTDYRFQVTRHGFLEEVFFDISYDPVRVEDGSVGGVFCIVSDTTGRVLNERRLRLLATLGARMANAGDIESVVKSFVAAVGDARDDLPFVRVQLHEAWSVGPGATDVGEVPEAFDDLPVTARPVDVPLGGGVGAVAIPLRVGTSELGSVLLGVNPVYPLDSPYRLFLSFVAERLATALANAEIYQSEHRVATTLQRAILPARLPEGLGVEMAAQYLPATEGLDVGGDWYDSLRLPDGTIALVIGDVAGKGVAAAAMMGQLRNALRAYLLDGHGPADALHRLNRLTHRLDARELTTVLCAALDTGTGVLRWASAGHLPAMLVGARGAHYLDGVPGPPIAVLDGATYPQHEQRLERGDTLVLFTDGLVEDRAEDLDVGFARAAAAAAVPGRSVERLVDTLCRLRPIGERADDIAVLAARFAH